MPLFDAENRLRSDGCALGLRVDDTKKLADYTFLNFRDLPCVEKGRMRDFAGEYRNLQPWDGYGYDTTAIDIDSRFRYASDSLTHGKCRQQLSNRTFQAVPLLQRGTVLPGLESRLLSGHDTSRLRECDRVAEKQLLSNAFHPCLDNVVEPSGCRIGLRSSRDIARSREFLLSLGYVYDGRVWRRPSGSP